MKLGHTGDRASRLIERARQAAAHWRRPGCSVWACQIEPLVTALADELERATAPASPNAKASRSRGAKP